MKGNSNTVKYPEITVKLVDGDGNAFAIPIDTRNHAADRAAFGNY